MPSVDPTPRLIIGPLLRRVVGNQATIWVETDRPARVRVRAGQAYGETSTFTVHRHHYALILVDGLTPGAASTYQVWLDDTLVWPDPEFPYPPSVIRTRRSPDTEQPVRLVFGSCRESTQHASSRRLPPDALDAYARRLAAHPPPPDDWPDLLVLLGDQVYADEPSRAVRRRLRRRRHATTPASQVISFEEYTQLYRESWSDPEIRYLLSTVPSVMIFDDHEIIDDWNTSADWRADIRAQPWWSERITAGLASYWVYQHLGNLSPAEIATDAVYPKVISTDDATDVLTAFAEQVDATADPPAADPPAAKPPAADLHPAVVGRRWASTYQWSYALDIGRTRLIVLDNRCSRVLAPANRAMVPPAQWRWFTKQAYGSFDHLVVGSSLPWLLPPGVHHLESWSEQVAGSPRRAVAAFAERLRRGLDLEHWAAFRRSFDLLTGLFCDLGAGRPQSSSHTLASISVLSGDVHHSYLARAHLGPEVNTAVHQLVCSPLHNQVPAIMRPFLRLGWLRPAATAARWLARSAGVSDPPVRWQKLAGPYFGNAVGTLVHADRTARVTIEGTNSDETLSVVLDHVLVADRSVPKPGRLRSPSMRSGG